jgi:hypothetical protein
MAQRNKIPGSFEIWRQMEGSGPTFIVAIHNTRDVENVLIMLAEQSRQHGLKVTENRGGGFTAYTRKRVGKKMTMAPEYHYWFETVMDEEHPDLDDAILTRLAEAMIMGGLEGRARREAMAAGIDFEGEGEAA